MTLDKTVLFTESGSLQQRQPQRADDADFAETLPAAMGLRPSFFCREHPNSTSPCALKH